MAKERPRGEAEQAEALFLRSKTDERIRKKKKKSVSAQRHRSMRAAQPKLAALLP
jgi:hypothetical protein